MLQSITGGLTKSKRSTLVKFPACVAGRAEQVERTIVVKMMSQFMVIFQLAEVPITRLQG